MAFAKNESNKNILRDKQIFEMKKNFMFTAGYPILEAMSEEASQSLQDYTEQLMDFCNELFMEYTFEKINLTQLKEVFVNQLKNENINSGSVMVDGAFVALRDRVCKLEEINYQSTNRNGLFANQTKPENDPNDVSEYQNKGMG